jgi:hypothetical protein
VHDHNSYDHAHVSTDRVELDELRSEHYEQKRALERIGHKA